VRQFSIRTVHCNKCTQTDPFQTINFVSHDFEEKEEYEGQRRELDDEEDELQNKGKSMKIVRT
jgi:hypothetical protein